MFDSLAASLNLPTSNPHGSAVFDTARNLAVLIYARESAWLVYDKLRWYGRNMRRWGVLYDTDEFGGIFQKRFYSDDMYIFAYLAWSTGHV